MKKIFVFITIALSLSILQSEEIDRKLNMPEKIRKAINEDMQVVQSHMNQILDSMSRGQWNTIYENAKDLENDYLMKMKMDKKVKEMMLKELPKGFLQSDKQFHYWAKVLAAGAKKKNAVIMTKAYSELVNTCMTCHAQYAPYMAKDFKDYIPPKQEDPKAIYKHPDDWR